MSSATAYQQKAGFGANARNDQRPRQQRLASSLQAVVDPLWEKHHVGRRAHLRAMQLAKL